MPPLMVPSIILASDSEGSPLHTTSSRLSLPPKGLSRAYNPSSGSTLPSLRNPYNTMPGLVGTPSLNNSIPEASPALKAKADAKLGSGNRFDTLQLPGTTSASTPLPLHPDAATVEEVLSRVSSFTAFYVSGRCRIRLNSLRAGSFLHYHSTC